MLLAGCAHDRIRDESLASLAAGDYEQAIRTLEAGLREHPEATALRSALVQARLDAQNRLLDEAAALRAGRRWPEARAQLERARALDPRNARLRALAEELAGEERQAATLAEAESLLERQRPDAALRLVEQALKDDPRHAGLRALQRRLELDARQAAARAAQSTLAETRPVSLDFRDASLRSVLDVVSRSSGINFVLDRDIRADTRVTVFLRQARIEDALDLITTTHQLAKKVIDPQTIVVYPNTAEKRREYQEQVVRVFYLSSADAKGAAAFLRSMLNIREPYVEERTNMLSVRDSQENIQLAERLVALYDAGEPEVLLEVEVLEVSATRLTELGVKFPSSLSLTPLAPDGSTNLTLGNVRTLDRDRVAVGLGGLLLNLKREVGDFTTLANPRIRVKNREKAKVLIGDKVPIVTTTTGIGGFVSDSVSYLDVGLKLDVEPTVFPDDEVAIRVALEVSSLGAATKTASGTLAYQIGTRNASTLLRLRDGETQLLAGLISREERSSSSRLPGLGDVPVLGRLFSSQLDDGRKSELVLAITPRVLRNIRRPTANESELWIGTEAHPRLRLPLLPAASAAAASASASGVARATPSPLAADLPATAPPQPRFALQWEGPAEVAAGGIVEVVLALDTAEPMRGLPLSFQFPRDKLQWLEAREGDYFRRDGASTQFTTTVDAGEGRGRVGTLRTQATAAVGQGKLLTLRFKALAPGRAEVKLDPLRPIALQPVEWTPALPPPFVVFVK